MSIDLAISVEKSLQLQAVNLLAGSRNALLNLLNLEDVPQIQLFRIVGGVASPEPGVLVSDSLYTLRYSKSEDQAWITTLSDEDSYPTYFSVSAAATREPTEYALALAAALAIASIANSQIQDSFRFWSESSIMHASLALKILSVEDRQSSFQEACLALLGGRLS